MSSTESPQNQDNGDRDQDEVLQDLEIEKVLTEVEHSLKELRKRYTQVKRDWQKHSALVKYQKELSQKKANNFEKEPIKTELRDIEQQINELEIHLESVLLPDLFWQAIRFGGLGIVIGWLLKSLAG